MNETEFDLGRLGSMSFRVMDESVGRPYPFSEEPEGGEYPLPAWHRSVYNRPFREFEMIDLNRALHNGLSHEFQYLVPYTLHVLRGDPLAGDFYDGDVLLSLKAVPKAYWVGHPEQRDQVREVLRAAQRVVSSEEYWLPKGDSLPRDLADLETLLP